MLRNVCAQKERYGEAYVYLSIDPAPYQNNPIKKLICQTKMSFDNNN